MVSTQIGKRLSERNSQRWFRVVPLIPAVILLVDTDGKSVLFPRATINQTLISAFCDKFGCPILSLIVWNFSVRLTTGFRVKLYNSLQEKFKTTNGFLSNQNRYALIYGWSLQPLNQQFKYTRFSGWTSRGQLAKDWGKPQWLRWLSRWFWFEKQYKLEIKLWTRKQKQV